MSKLDFNVSSKIVESNKSNENNDFNKIKDYTVPLTFLTSDYIKQNIQLLANANNLTLKDMFNKILLEYIESNQDIIEMISKIQNK